MTPGPSKEGVPGSESPESPTTGERSPPVHLLERAGLWKWEPGRVEERRKTPSPSGIVLPSGGTSDVL